jgi:DNA repair protein SbcD/Mre11
MIKILHLSDVHLGSGFSQGRLNPETGLNTRLEDFVSTLSKCMDRAIAEPVDLVLFGGDAFPDATPPPIVQEAFASQFRRLVDADIPTVLLVGNHDQHSQGSGGASLSIYRTLGVPGFVVGDRLHTHVIQTRGGPIQVVTLPWLTRSALLTRPDTEGMSLAEVSQLLIQRLAIALEGEIRRLQPDVPTILLAHLMADTARYGAERFLAVGKGFTIPMSLLTRPCFDYVALGHVHRHQVLSTEPLMIYPGSIERVDFGEEFEDKGFVLVEVEKGRAEFKFCPLPVRAFRTIEVDLSEHTTDPQAVLLQAIAGHEITDAIVRLIYRLRPDQLELIDASALHQSLGAAHSYTIHPELVSQLSRPRLPKLSTGDNMTPVDALRTYLEHRPDLSDVATEMLSAAQSLLAGEEETWLQSSDSPMSTPTVQSFSEINLNAHPSAQGNANVQLRLL